MTRIVFIALLFLLFTSFMPPKEKESFEGVITYKISFVPKPGNEEYTKHQSQKFGKSLILSLYKNGNFKRDYPFSGMLFGTEFSIYTQSLNRLYTKMRTNDTIKASDCAKNTLIQKEETDREDEIINGVTCKSYFISGGDARSKQPTSLHYFYPVNKEFIDWKLYTNFNDLFYNKVVFKMQAPFYKLVMDNTKYSIVFELEKIEPKKLPINILNFPKGKPVKEL